MPFSKDTIRISRVGPICVAGGNVKFTSSSENNYTTATETLPAGYRPKYATNIPIAVFGGNTTFILYGEHSGKVIMLGNPNNAYAGCTGAWVTNDPMPA